MTGADNVDEVAFKKGHRYITVISDRDGRALALTDDRGTESLAGYLRTLTDGQLLAIKTLSMDMNAGYIRAARIHLPCAVEKIAFDRFHVAKQLGEVVDKTRQNERKRLVRTVLIFTESSDQLSRATDRVPGLPASPGYVQ
ncbi:transposase [Escherichia coli]|nr:hypothetical protein [Escherichia coli]EFF0523040.1 transposase [Escherichia coli]EFF9286382.1 hypothetical protein [Escherichia coli]EFO0731322.1 hypothetical protein [Escherichia coli]EGD7216995.1 hypothetical protein [Escherichia coli]